MLLEITLKELLIHLRSLRFSLTLLLLTATMLLAGIVFAQKYHQMVSDHGRMVNRDFEAMRTKVKSLNQLAFYAHRVYKSPNPLRLCAEGREKHTPNSFEITISRTDGMANQARVNFLQTQMQELDWAFLIGVIVSFAAILLTYDAICGEREGGTLRLMLSNAVPRATLLLGKYLGALVSLALALGVALLLNLLLVLTLGVPFTGEQWARTGLIVLASLVYMSAFLMLGLFVSSLTRHATTSFVLLLFLWTLFVVIIPSSGGVLASKLSKVPPQREISRQLGDAWSQVGDRYPSDTFNWGWDFKLPVPEQVRRRGKATWEIATVQDQIRDKYRNQLMRQVHWAENWMRLSPTMVYTFFCESIANTGSPHFERFLRQVKNYQGEWYAWIIAEDQKDVESFHLVSNEEWTRPLSQKEVAFAQLPRFAERPPTVTAGIQSAILDGTFLILVNVFCFLGAFGAFLRYDVR